MVVSLHRIYSCIENFVNWCEYLGVSLFRRYGQGRSVAFVIIGFIGFNLLLSQCRGQCSTFLSSISDLVTGFCQRFLNRNISGFRKRM